MPANQVFKAIYFPDYKTVNPNAKGFVLAFGERNRDLYQTLAPLSSQEVRELLGTSSFVELENSAKAEGLPVSTYCIWRLRKAMDGSPEALFNGYAITGQARKELEPIHVTFKGGKQNPLHDWYSLLEGYSPAFVEYVLDTFAQNATVVYDPFAGTGVTPLVAARRGLASFYSEINPLLQFLVKTKITASALTQKGRASTISTLEGIRSLLEMHVTAAAPNSELRHTYSATFAESQFFEPADYELVLRARTFVDELSYSNQLVADIVLVAILNSLVVSSLLQRAGDLRYKNSAELKRKANFIRSVDVNLARIIEDLKRIEPLPVTPVLVSENAKFVDRLPELKIDAVIASPPYLNGTNYFRNTKVELWFLRSIKTQDDLTDFRRASVTAGINDVSLKKQLEFTTPKIQKVVRLLNEKAYDQRIPKMVQDYFQDIARIFDSLRIHLKDRADVAIDIGDSIYGGVRVPTDDLFIDVLEQLNYEHKRSVTLRKRLSRNGEVLKQVLLIFKAPRRKAKQANGVVRKDWQKNWILFKKMQPHRKEPFSKRNWGHPLHSLCSYQGKMKPSLAHFLVKTFTNKGHVILDPFAGVGTIPFEAALNGVRSFGFEISNAALSIAKAKLGKCTQKESFSYINRLKEHIQNEKLDKRALEEAKEFGFNKKLAEYFEPRTLREIVAARGFFKAHPLTNPSENLVFGSLLHILHGNRPYALSRRSHGITPFAPTGRFEYKRLIDHLKEKVERSYLIDVPEDFVEGEMLYQDATSWWPRRIDNLDAIVTSPPFFDSTRFYLANWLRLWFSGWDPKDFDSRPRGFVDEKQKETFAVYEPVLRQARERLKPGGVLVFHLGKSRKCDMAERLTEIAKRWFKVADVFEENVEDTESHGITDKGTVVKHQFLILN